MSKQAVRLSQLVPSSETLDHLIRYLSSWSGTDKFFMVIQYSLRLIVPILRYRAQLQHKRGLRPDERSDLADRCKKFAGIIGNSRTLYSLWGILPIIQWLVSLERNPQPTKKHLFIERLQGWSMIAFYPLSHASYFSSQDIVPSTITVPSPLSFASSSNLEGEKPSTVTLNPGALGMWSCRFWSLYIALQLVHLREDRKLLIQRIRALKRGSSGAKPITDAEKLDVRKRWDGLYSNFLQQACNLPLALNWSTESGFLDEFWVGALGLTAGLIGFRSGWRATELPPPAPVVEEDEKEIQLSKTTLTSQDPPQAEFSEKA